MSEISARSLLARTLSVGVALAAAMALSPAALAETREERERRARELYQQGQAHAQEGRWEAATDAWLEAYEAQPLPLILFNVAQAYRQLGDCPAALYFYQRYLRDDPESQFAEVAAGHVENLETQCEPSSPWDDDEPEPEEVEESDEDPEPEPVEEPEPDPQPVQPMSPPTLVGFAEVGPAFAQMGDLNVPVLTTIRAGVAHPLDLGVVEIQAGAATTFTPVPWTNNGESGTALLTGLMANAAARYPVASGLFARGELGLGALIFSGIAHEDSVFLEEGLGATGALSMFHLRVQLGAEYELARNVAISVSPLAFSFSPSRYGLRESMGNLTRFELLAGLSVRI